MLTTESRNVGYSWFWIYINSLVDPYRSSSSLSVSRLAMSSESRFREFSVFCTVVLMVFSSNVHTLARLHSHAWRDRTRGVYFYLTKQRSNSVHSHDAHYRWFGLRQMEHCTTRNSRKVFLQRSVSCTWFDLCNKDLSHSFHTTDHYPYPTAITHPHILTFHIRVLKRTYC